MKYLLGFVILPFASIALAETVSVPVSVDFVPDKAVGIVITKERFEEKGGAKMKKISESAVEVSFDIDRSTLGEDSLLTAAVRSKDGKVGYGEVRSARDAEKGRSIPACQPATLDDVRLREQMGVLASLIEIRKNRRDVARQKLHNLLNEQTVDKYRTLEEGFGLAKNQELSSELNPFYLAGRLSRLLLVIRSYNSLKANP